MVVGDTTRNLSLNNFKKELKPVQRHGEYNNIFYLKIKF